MPEETDERSQTNANMEQRREGIISANKVLELLEKAENKMCNGKNGCSKTLPSEMRINFGNDVGCHLIPRDKTC